MPTLLHTLGSGLERIFWRPLANIVIEHWLGGNDEPARHSTVPAEPSEPPEPLYVQNAMQAIRENWPEEALLQVFGTDVLRQARLELKA